MKVLAYALCTISVWGWQSSLSQLRPRHAKRKSLGATAVVAPPKMKSDPDAKLKSGIAGFYDGLSGLWEDVWGEHLHHGYYDEGKKYKNIEAHKEAQIRMIDETLKWANLDQPPATVLDVGCGIGGASRHIAELYTNSTVRGITLSPYQAARATDMSLQAGLDKRCDFKVQDALALPADWQYDLVWSLESGEHMPNKPRFVNNLVQACKPQGRIVLVTWCHRDLKPKQKKLRFYERMLLGIINKCYYLPPWCSVNDYERLFARQGMDNIQRDDWTDRIAPFWPAVIKTALKPSNTRRLLGTGIDGLRSAIAMILMLFGYKIGLIKFGLVSCLKPPETSGYTAPPSTSL